MRRYHTDIVVQGIMISNLNPSVCRVAQPCVDHSEKALGFIVSPSVLNHYTITEDTTDENSLVAQMEHAWMSIMRMRGSKEVI